VHAGTATLVPLHHPLAAGGLPTALVGERLVYLGQVDGATALVSEGPSDVRVISLPPVTGTPLTITDSVPSGWVLVGRYQQPLYRVNVQTGELVEIGLRMPDGLRRFQGGIFGSRLDLDGGLLTALRDDYSGALYRSLDGATWSPVGGTVTNVLDIVGLDRAGTYLVAGTNARYSEETWSPAIAGHEPDLNGESLQVVRPAQAIRRLADGARTWDELVPSQISLDGACMAYWQHAGDGTPTQTFGLAVLDVERGKLYDVLPMVETEPYGAMTWVPGQ
jgi:hypothetical protein